MVFADGARADVVVRPGASGSICSEYKFIQRNPNRYFQTCMYADASRVWAVMYVGNASETTWNVHYDTTKARCNEPRPRAGGANQARAVLYPAPNQQVVLMSDTLQVQ